MCNSPAHGTPENPEGAPELPRVPASGSVTDDHHCVSEIGTTPDRHGLLPYTLNIRVFIETPATFPDTIMVETDRNGNRLVDANGQPTEMRVDTTYTCVSPVPDSAMDNFWNAFVDSVNAHWNDKLYLSTRRHTRRGIPGLRCCVALTRTTNRADAHLYIKMLYRYQPPANAHWETREFRAYCDRGGRPGHTTEDMAIDYPGFFLNQDGSRGFRPETGTRDDFQVQRNLRTSNHGTVPINQNTAAHEFGHYIGLDHTCAGDGTANSTAAYCAARSRGLQSNVMAAGNIIQPLHAQPWLDRLSRHHRYCELAWRYRSLTRDPPSRSRR